LQYKAPKHLPDAKYKNVKTKHINSAEQTNVCLTQQIRNAMELSGVLRPTSTIRSDEVDPLFLSKSIQQQAMFAQSYEVDPSSTANNIIIIPAVQNKQLSTVKLDNNGTEFTPVETNIDGTVDGQVFDEIQNGSIFQFTANASNTSTTVNITVRIKRLTWEIGTSSQIVETVDFTYPLKNYNGFNDVAINDILANTKAVVIFDNTLNVFKLLQSNADLLIKNEIRPNITTLQNLVQPATATTQGLAYLTTKVNLTYNSATSLLYSVVDAQTKEEITNGTINLSTIGVNGLDTGTLQPNATYHIFEIKDLTNNLVKTITSTSLVSPTLPSGFTKKKHIFSFITNSSSQLRTMQIFNIGNNQYYISYTNPIAEFVPTTVSNTGTNLQLTVPSNIEVKVFLGVRAFGVTTSNIAIGVAPPHVVNDTVSNSAFNVWFGGNTGAHDGGNEVHSFTDTNRTAKFFGRSDTTPTSLSIFIYTKGYYLYL
jgi:hypothetical protein